MTEGRVIASAMAEVAVRKVGFERFIENSANHWGLYYGFAAVVLSIGMGWAASRFYAMI